MKVPGQLHVQPINPHAHSIGGWVDPTAGLDGSGGEKNPLLLPALRTCLFAASHVAKLNAAQQRRDENTLHKRSRNYFTKSGS